MLQLEERLPKTQNLNSPASKSKMDLQKTCSKCGRVYPYDVAVCLDDGFPLVVVRESLVRGSKIGQRYVLEEEIGQGGMGAIFKARHITMDRHVAIKVLLADISKDPQAMLRFQVEARAASILSHANIITIHEFDITEHGIPYLVMEYLDGFTLHDLLAQKYRLPYEDALPIFIKICAALSHAHGRNVVHRDLKPSNIMMSIDETLTYQPKLLDFGIAKMFTSPGKTAMRLTLTGEVFGSPMYMSPEQCMGQAVDARSDIYSLGCVLYEVLTGVPPIQGENFLALVYAHLRDLPLTFAEVASDFVVPAELEAIVQKALHKDPTKRHDSMRDLQQELEVFLAAKRPEPSAAEQKESETKRAEPQVADLAEQIEQNFIHREDNMLAQLTRKAEDGDVDAQYELGCFYFDGNMVERDYVMAFHWYQKAANQKFPDGIAWLGVLYRNGEGVEQDYKKAMALFQEGANLEHGFSQSLLADSYQFGWGTEVDLDLSAYWNKKGVENNCVNSMMALASLYQDGIGVEVDQEKAAELYLHAAEKGDPDAQNRIGKMYADGIGIEKNLEEAAAWYLSSALQGNVDAKGNLAICYVEGCGVEKDEDEALIWMQCAADEADARAQNWIAYWYENGMMGFDCDLSKAFHWYTKAALKKDSWAQYKLGSFSENGDGVRKDLKQAVNWYTRAADQGVREAQLSLAFCYRDGLGVAKNTTKYLDWLQRAADQDLVDALYELGVHHQEVAKDPKTARKYFKKAADLGDSRAKEMLIKANFS